jgi:hypothetical protein
MAAALAMPATQRFGAYPCLLRDSIHTGMSCRYSPNLDGRVTWITK